MLGNDHTTRFTAPPDTLPLQKFLEAFLGLSIPEVRAIIASGCIRLGDPNDVWYLRTNLLRLGIVYENALMDRPEILEQSVPKGAKLLSDPFFPYLKNQATLVYQCEDERIVLVPSGRHTTPKSFRLEGARIALQMHQEKKCPSHLYTKVQQDEWHKWHAKGTSLLEEAIAAIPNQPEPWE